MTAPNPPLWRNRDYALLWTGGAVSQLGTSISSLAYPLLVLALTGSPVRAGVVGSVDLAAATAFRLVGGAVADRVDRRLLMLVADAGRCLALGSVGAAIAFDVVTYGHLLAATFCDAALSQFFRPAATAAMRRVVPPDQIGDAVARNEARSIAAQLAGPPVGGALFALSRLAPFVADAVSYVWSLVATLLLRVPQSPARRAVRTTIARDIVDGLRWVWRDRVIRLILVLASLTNLVFSALALTLIVVARRHGASSGVVGLMLALGSAGGLAGALVAPRLIRVGRPSLVLRGILSASAVVVPVMALAQEPFALGALYAAALFLAPAANTILFTYQITTTPDELQGRVESAGVFVAGLAAPVAPVMAGVLLTVAGSTSTLLVLAAVQAGVAAVVVGARQLRAIDTPAAAGRASV
jgi:predicted MFS family arabinose efflux permease